MTFTAVGTILQTTTASLTVNPGTAGNLVLVEVITESSTVFCNGISGGNCTWTQVGTAFKGTTTAYYAAVFAGQATATGSATATLSFSGSTPTIRCAGQQFSSTAGSWAIDGSQGNLDSADTATSPSLTPAAAGDLYFFYVYTASSMSNGSTSGFTYQEDTNSNGLVYNPGCTSSAQAPVWGGSTAQFGVAVLLRETPAISAPPPLLIPPGLFSPMAFASAPPPPKPSPPPPWPDFDTGTGTDTGSVVASVSDTDTGSGADTGSGSPGATSADSGSGADTGSITGAGTADTGTGTDAATVTASVSAADSGGGAESGGRLASSADTGSAAESASGGPYIAPFRPASVLWSAPDKLSKSGGSMP